MSEQIEPIRPSQMTVPPQEATTAPPILELRGVTKDFGGFVAISDVSLAFEEGGLYGIIGPNGAGKTTLFNLLSGFLPPSRGSLWHRGVEITGQPPQEIARRGIVRSFQITSIFGNLTIADNIVLALQPRFGGESSFWTINRGRDRFRHEIDQTLDEVGIPTVWKERPAASLPYGMKRSLELGISLATDPQLLLLDEPTAGMTVQDLPRITELIQKIAASRTIIIVEHNLGVIADLAEEIIVIQQGRVLTRGPYDTVRQDPRVIEAYLGSKAHA
jgi:branched-chain amino acid transport system ATP-binding protein